MSPRLEIVIDSAGLICTAYHAAVNAVARSGDPAAYSVVGEAACIVMQLAHRAIEYVARDFGPLHRPPVAAAVLEPPASLNRRRQEHSGYKDRPPKPPELRELFDLAPEIYAAAGVHTCTPDVGEADDGIYTLARASAKAGETCYIVSQDKDFYPLVAAGYCRQVRRAGGQWQRVTHAQIVETFGVEPQPWETGPAWARRLHLCHVLVGDAVDGIPGVQGIGPGKAARIARHVPSVGAFREMVARLADGAVGVADGLGRAPYSDVRIIMGAARATTVQAIDLAESLSKLDTVHGVHLDYYTGRQPELVAALRAKLGLPPGPEDTDDE